MITLPSAVEKVLFDCSGLKIGCYAPGLFDLYDLTTKVWRAQTNRLQQATKQIHASIFNKKVPFKENLENRTVKLIFLNSSSDWDKGIKSHNRVLFLVCHKYSPEIGHTLRTLIGTLLITLSSAGRKIKTLLLIERVMSCAFQWVSASSQTRYKAIGRCGLNFLTNYWLPELSKVWFVTKHCHACETLFY